MGLKSTMFDFGLQVCLIQFGDVLTVVGEHGHLIVAERVQVVDVPEQLVEARVHVTVKLVVFGVAVGFYVFVNLELLLI